MSRTSEITTKYGLMNALKKGEIFKMQTVYDKENFFRHRPLARDRRDAIFTRLGIKRTDKSDRLFEAFVINSALLRYIEQKLNPNSSVDYIFNSDSESHSNNIPNINYIPNNNSIQNLSNKSSSKTKTISESEFIIPYSINDPHSFFYGANAPDNVSISSFLNAQNKIPNVTNLPSPKNSSIPKTQIQKPQKMIKPNINNNLPIPLHFNDKSSTKSNNISKSSKTDETQPKAHAKREIGARLTDQSVMLNSDKASFDSQTSRWLKRAK